MEIQIKKKERKSQAKRNAFALMKILHRRTGLVTANLEDGPFGQIIRVSIC
jgi:hypothetical protein